MLRQVASFQKFFKVHPFLKSLSLCFVSASLLILSFPYTDIWIFAWIALVPFLFALDGKRLGAVCFLGLVTGILFFAGTVYWFIHVTMLGMFLIILYLSLYFLFFAFFVYLFRKKSALIQLFLLPSAWVALEFARGHLLSGFGWVSAGLSQYKILPLIQIADLTGIYGVSFLVVMGNVFITHWIKARLEKGKSESLRQLFRVVLFLITITLGYGFYRLNQITPSAQINVVIVQANIPQEIKWDPSAWPGIMAKYRTLTKEAALKKPDLIIWPETAFPGFIWEAPELFADLKDFVASLKIPLLLGIVNQREEEYFNSAIFISADGDVVAQYDKLHLVPFGEYIPLRNVFPFLSSVAPIGDFTPGKKYTLFPAPISRGLVQLKNAVFSVLICFEDTVPAISRQFVKRGSNLLVNLTNDAWFQDTKAPFLHMQAAVFRAVENRKYLIRATNTGVSCFINQNGKIIKAVEDENHRRTYVEGFAASPVVLSRGNTFYSNFGDVFTYLCFGGILMGMIMGNLNRKSGRSK